jgi:glycosyltransferase involved in cell wall biosynthesis
MISLIIPATTSNQRYTDFAIQQIRELYPNENEVEIVVEINDNVTLGVNYNNAVAKAKGDVVVLMHNDMVPHPGFVETILKHIERKMVLVYHRVEPPIYTDVYLGKSILDCGKDIET